MSDTSLSSTREPLLSGRWLSVVIPTYNERDNINYLLAEFEKPEFSALRDQIAQLVFVDDDSPDGTAQVIRESSSSLQVACIHRIGRSGLSSAVVEGMMAVGTPMIAVMDSDGQHRVSDLAAMAQRLTGDRADLIIGSRFLVASRLGEHAGLRLVASQLGNALARRLLGRFVSDPLTGFFIVSRVTLMDIVRDLRPIGFKILFDILFLLRHKSISLIEHQIDFSTRHAGQSKLDAAVIIEFVDQIAHRLTRGAVPEKFLSFVAVGGTGVGLHFAVLFGLVKYGTSFLVAQTTATLAAMISNYTLNNEITFRRHRRSGVRWATGLLLFIGFCSLGALANVGIANALFEQRYSWWLSGLAGVIVGTVFNFSLARSYVWKR